MIPVPPWGRRFELQGRSAARAAGVPPDLMIALVCGTSNFNPAFDGRSQNTWLQGRATIAALDAAALDALGDRARDPAAVLRQGARLLRRAYDTWLSWDDAVHAYLTSFRRRSELGGSWPIAERREITTTVRWIVERGGLV